MAIAVYRVTDRAVGAGVGGHEGDDGEEEDLHGLAWALQWGSHLGHGQSLIIMYIQYVNFGPELDIKNIPFLNPNY